MTGHDATEMPPARTPIGPPGTATHDMREIDTLLALVASGAAAEVQLRCSVTANGELRLSAGTLTPTGSPLFTAVRHLSRVGVQQGIKPSWALVRAVGEVLAVAGTDKRPL